MSAVLIAIFTLSAFSLAYRFYARFLAQQVFQSEGPGAEGVTMPAHEFRDDVDFIPTKKSVLFGHHFTSIAGAGPIVGPAIAVIWGWVPAVLWIVFGAIFIGAVHDFGCLVASTRSKGRSMAEITGNEVGPRAQALFLALILFLTWIVLAVFAYVIASLFVDYPASVLPINFEIVVALALGWAVHKRGVGLGWTSVAALVALYLMIGVGVWCPVTTHKAFLDEGATTRLASLAKANEEAAAAGLEERVDFNLVKPVMRYLASKGAAEQVLGAKVKAARSSAIKLWIYLLLGYSFVACCLPVWLLLQPRDYINSHQLFVGLGMLNLGLFVMQPEIVAPAFVAQPPGAPPWFPFIFVTIACGAISGFHGLVSSGTSSKQLEKLEDARPIGYGAMLGEATLGMIVTLACVAGFKSPEAWSDHYHSWAAAGPLDRKLDAFLSGGSWFMTAIGLPAEYGAILIAVIVISFAATTLDSAARVQRFVLDELGERLGKAGRPLRNIWFGSFVACATPVVLLDATTSDGKPLWTEIWPIFGAANQLLGALSLTVLTVWLVKRRRNAYVTLVPLLIIGSMTLYAFFIKLLDFWRKGIETGFANGKLILAVTLLLFALGLWILFEAGLALLRGKGPPEGAPEAA